MQTLATTPGQNYPTVDAQHWIHPAKAEDGIYGDDLYSHAADLAEGLQRDPERNPRVRWGGVGGAG